ncbi:hypothetical protein HK098_005809, partial [Nowakowskiella sp. JEL0407]
MSHSEWRLLQDKQQQLERGTHSESLSGPVAAALRAALLFAQEEAGSAVCVSKGGWVLSCAHCFGDSQRELVTRKWLLFSDGTPVLVDCQYYDFKLDLALAKIISKKSSSQSMSTNVDNIEFPFISIAQHPPKLRTKLICIGQPGQDDLESDVPGKKTNYCVLEVSEGRFRGMLKNVDPLDNEEIGTMKHDCWTYWGHSGAPLITAKDGLLVGLHSSWDEDTGMRHGVPLVAIRTFLQN